MFIKKEKKNNRNNKGSELRGQVPWKVDFFYALPNSLAEWKDIWKDICKGYMEFWMTHKLIFTLLYCIIIYKIWTLGQTQIYPYIRWPGSFKLRVTYKVKGKSRDKDFFFIPIL